MAAVSAAEGKKDNMDGKKSANLELEQSAELDRVSADRIAELENSSSEMAEAGLSRQNGGMITDKSESIEETSGDKKGDLAVPNWPKYSDPLAQRAEIDKELKQVKKQADDFKKNSDEAETAMKNKDANLS